MFSLSLSQAEQYMMIQMKENYSSSTKSAVIAQIYEKLSKSELSQSRSSRNKISLCQRDNLTFYVLKCTVFTFLPFPQIFCLF